MSAVTISSSYGANGAVIGPAVADRLGFDFYDRAIPVAVAHQLAIDAEEVLEYDEKPPSWMDRLLLGLSSSIIPLGPDPAAEVLDNPKRIRESTEALLVAIANGPGGVILGRAGMALLHNRPDVLSVRLDGPVDARIAQAMEGFAIDQAKARADQRETDRAREAYSQVFYGVSQTDASQYHVIVDSTALPVETCTEIIVAAALARLGVRR